MKRMKKGTIGVHYSADNSILTKSLGIRLLLLPILLSTSVIFAERIPASGENLFNVENVLNGYDGYNGYAALKADTTIIIQGTVYGQDELPLSSATIVDKRSPNKGTFTDKNGKFKLSVEPNSILVINHVNHLSSEIVVGTQSHILNVYLKEGTQQLEEVVVVGFGTTSIRKNTTAVTSVNTKAVKDIPFGDMGSALQGRVAGVIVQQGSAEPGQNGASISIRVMVSPSM
ncbi:carboxypeptidase-like regulatory domain-containing protein [Arachidicoccus ginsenosidivorans]|uniref:carboxypeptidase-like regulatory domain-containing protein n=1 Tax=Arachidicoccus ginsenosidivorans TaxID=496057 RepID=UPI001CEF5D0D|nr:carboxypeptidase-like regulatory domain-containing protein [Arachidicoccus ginsenosidivorans]